MKKILTAYYSYSGSTKEIAKMIQKEAGGDIFEIIPSKSYPAGYDAVVEQAKKEISAGYKPELKEKIKNIADYDIIFVGSPNWWSTIAPPVTAFLSANDLSGKTVVPFCTHGGGGASRCFTDTLKLCPGSKTAQGIAFYGNGGSSAHSEITKWVKKVIK